MKVRGPKLAGGLGIQGLPRPYQDELLYSVVARASYRSAHWSPKGLAETVFGDRTVLACPDLPSRLRLFQETAGAPWRMGVAEIAMRYTVVGYYTHFLGTDGRDRILALMAGKQAYLHLRLGICSGKVRAPVQFRLCPACTAADVASFGETYWRRSHHLPGVLVCPIHVVSLLEVEVPFRAMGRHEHVFARARFLETGHALLPSGTSPGGEVLRLAWAAAALLDAPVSRVGPFHDYREALRQRGFRTPGDGENLWRCLLERFGPELLQVLVRDDLESATPVWVRELFRTPRQALHPLKHLLLRRVLSALDVGQETSVVQPERSAPLPAKTWGIFRDEGLRQKAQALFAGGLTVNAVAGSLDVDWKTADRLLQPLPDASTGLDEAEVQADRREWLKLVSDDPGAGRTRLRQRAPALYARLYRRDHDWLMAHGDRLASKELRTKVPWAARDRKLAEAVREQVQKVKTQQPLRRASANHVLGVLKSRTLVNRYGNKLPITRAALRHVCESVADFQLRRTLELGLRDDFGSKPVWRVMRDARLNSERFPDKGRRLVDGARKLRGMVSGQVSGNERRG